MSVQLVIKIAAKKVEFPINIDRTATIEELKEQVGNKASAAKENIRLVCAGRIWQDNCNIDSYAPTDGAIVHCINSAPKLAAASGIASTTTLQAADPMMAMIGSTSQPPASGSMPAPPPANASPEQVMQHSLQMLQNNPETMQQMMNSPMVQNMMNDPEQMNAMMRMNPLMNRLMESNPEMGARMAERMQNPDIMRQAMDVIRNPSLAREMQRNHDRTVGNMDTAAGGYQALMQANQSVDSMYNAISTSGSSNGNAHVSEQTLAEYAAQTEGSRNTQALSNPWGAPTALASNALASQGSRDTSGPSSTTDASGSADAGAAFDPSNPMSNPVVQGWMQNPAMLQQSMQMAQQSLETGEGGVAPSDPMAAMLQNMMGSQAGASGGSNPMEHMMRDLQHNPRMLEQVQQIMQNPAEMQQAMQMAQQQFGGGANVATIGAGNGGENPMAAMMQQMMSQQGSASTLGGNPMQMQQNYQAMMNNQDVLAQRQAALMANPELLAQRCAQLQQMYGVELDPNAVQQMMAGTPPANQAAASPPAAAPTSTLGPMFSQTNAQTPTSEEASRARFASQLTQLAAMGFTNEELCLQALSQNHGRVDQAIDALISMSA